MKNVLVLGFFDGIHLGHQEVISRAVKYSKENEAVTTLITFLDAPFKYFNKNCEYILSREDSVTKIKELGIDEVIEQDFSQIVNLSAEVYLKLLYREYSPIAIFTGFNHTFGANRSGNPKFLAYNQKKYNYDYYSISPRYESEEIVSSTIIKDYLKSGDVEKANLMLGAPFYIKGIVEGGARLGRTIGFPTANISYPDEIVKIPYGVYKVGVNEGVNQGVNQNLGVLNWGLKPTVGNVTKPVAEVHILGVNQDLYGKEIKISFIKKLRDEKRFENIEELKLQIQEDIKKCLES